MTIEKMYFLIQSVTWCYKNFWQFKQISFYLFFHFCNNFFRTPFMSSITVAFETFLLATFHLQLNPLMSVEAWPVLRMILLTKT